MAGLFLDPGAEIVGTAAGNMTRRPESQSGWLRGGLVPLGRLPAELANVWVLPPRAGILRHAPLSPHSLTGSPSP
jgi:hypothetical protein